MSNRPLCFRPCRTCSWDPGRSLQSPPRRLWAVRRRLPWTVRGRLHPPAPDASRIPHSWRQIAHGLQEDCRLHHIVHVKSGLVQDCLLMFSSARVVCSVIPPATSWSVAGSRATCPEVNSRSPTQIAWEYGPMAAGASLVEIATFSRSLMGLSITRSSWDEHQLRR